uniref:DNA-directed RNA polymerase n=1 Tax=Seriola lalandi dorsalis TaxID=1841481 RepID=A0A3B4Y8X7_SERLL
MDYSTKWSNLPKAPSLKNLTQGGFGVLKEAQHAAVQDLTKAHIESFDQAVTDGLSRVVQAIPPLEFTIKNDRISLSFVEATVYNPVVAKGNICKEMRVFPAECRGRRCSYKGKLTVCTLCGKSDSIDSVSVPYVFRYFIAELAAMNIKVKLDVK